MNNDASTISTGRWRLFVNATGPNLTERSSRSRLRTMDGTLMTGLGLVRSQPKAASRIITALVGPPRRTLAA